MSSYSGTPSPLDNPDGTADYDIIPRAALTFGVELEFGIACLPYGYIDPQPQDPRQVYGILETERPGRKLAGISCLGLHEPIDIDDNVDEFSAIQLHIADTLKQQGLSAWSELDGDATDYELETSWLVKDDPTIKFPPLNYKFRTVEVISPPFQFCEEALNEVKVVCKTLPSRYRLILNTSCSLHVHVGNGINGFTVPHLRNLMAMLWAFEPQLDTLHPQHRVGPTRYSGSLRKHSNLGREVKARGLNARDGLRRLFGVREINEMVDLLGVVWIRRATPGTLSYSIKNLMENGCPGPYKDFLQAEDTKKTVEFRHHEGTFDLEAVLHWVVLCVRLVEFAEEVRPERLRQWLEEHIDTDYNVIQILEAIKQPEAAEYYEKKLAERAALGPDTTKRIKENFHVDHLEESLRDDYTRDLGAWCQEREKVRYN